MAGWFGRLAGRVRAALQGRAVVDEAVYEELEGALLGADVGIETATDLLARLRSAVATTGCGPEGVEALLCEEVAEALAGAGGALHLQPREQGPSVILLVGVNGVGKTTTVAKLGRRLQRDGHRVLLAAADTFRAAAGEQLDLWARRIGADVVGQGTGADPAAVVHDAITAARARGADVVLADTAGRLHTRVNLMEELRKVARIAGRAVPGAPHDVLLVLDATTGQNGLVQARAFAEAVPLTGLVLTKLDSSARGGMVLAIHRALGLPICFLGTGEGADDLAPFDPRAFAADLFASAPAAG